QSPEADQEILVAMEMGCSVGQIGTDEPTAATLEWIAGRSDEADGRFFQHVLFDTHHRHGARRRERVDITRANYQGAKVRPADAAIHLSAVVDRHLLSGQQSDAAAEERKHIQVGGQSEAKVEDVRAFEK